MDVAHMSRRSLRSLYFTGVAEVELKYTINFSRLSQRMKNTIVNGCKTGVVVGSGRTADLANLVVKQCGGEGVMRLNSWSLSQRGVAIPYEAWAELASVMLAAMRVSSADANNRYQYEFDQLRNIAEGADNSKITVGNGSAWMYMSVLYRELGSKAATNMVKTVMAKHLAGDERLATAERVKEFLNSDKEVVLTTNELP